MPVRPTYPGVYVEEIASGVRPVTAVATSTAAFIGTFARGLLDEAVQILSYADFEREYGGLDRNSEASYAVQQFFLNGGSEAWVVRIGQPGPVAAPITAVTSAANGTLNSFGGAAIFDFTAGRRIRGASATNPGDWGNYLRIEVEHNDSRGTAIFNLFVSEVAVAGNRTTTLRTETFRNLSMDPGAATYAIDVVNQGSQLVQLTRDSALNDFTAPAASGTISSDLGASVPVLANDLTVALSGGTPILLAVALPVSPSLIDWTAAFQSALRKAGADLSVAPGDRAYFTAATVVITGDGSVANPRRFVIRAGKGAQPYDPAATLSFGGTDATLYGLAAPTAIDPQQFEPTAASGADGTIIDAATGAYLIPSASFRGSPLTKTGLYAIDDMDIVNIIAMPDAPRMVAADYLSAYAEAIAYADSRRSMILVDIPESVVTTDQIQTWMATNDSLRDPNAVVYYPRTLIADPLNQNRQRSLAASGTIAGLWGRTDTARGVWKAPAGTEARLRNVDSLAYVMTDLENGTLNPIGVNCLRNFPVYSNICWGARTLDGADVLASDWKYVPVRRTTLFIEESLYRGTKWVVFEPNDEPLWAQIRLNVSAFMQDLFRKGAFQGSSPAQAYLVKCDGETTTQTDIDNGVVNIEVGFAPLKPAEFVILKIQQIARVAAE